MADDPLTDQTPPTTCATTSFDLYLCRPSLSSTGFQPEELEGHVIIEADLKIEYNASVFHQLVPKSSLETRHIAQINYYGRDNGPPIYFQGAWNFDRHKKPRLNNRNNDSGDSDDKSDASTDIVNTDVEALDSQGSGMVSDGTWSHDEYDGTAQPGSKRGRKPSSTEKDLQCLFETVQYALRRKQQIRAKIPFPISKIERYWSAEFADSPIPDPYNAQKPDVALFYYKSKTSEKTWTDVLSFVEHTTSDFNKRRDLGVYWGSATKAYLIMREQPWRRFVLSFFISADHLYAHYCDRSGLIITLPIPIQSSPARVADAIATLSLADPSLLGLDPTTHMCITFCQGTHTDLAVGAIGWVTDNAEKKYSIMAVLWKSQGLFCRGTVCYRVRDPVDGKEYAMKDCWVTEAKRYHEVDVLGRVKGIPNVVQLVDHWDVLSNGEPDCTARIRDGYGVLLENRPDTRFFNRYHRRLLLTPCGDPLWDFSSRKELICAFRDFVVAHETMIQRRVLHGDLSPNNFIIHEGIGYFIDFDHASIIKEGETFTVSFGTGTVPYISMRILKKMSKNVDILKKAKTINAKKNDNTNSIAQPELVEHNSSDDLESLFYIFFEFVSKYGGAHGTLAPTWDKMSMPWADAYENLGATSGLLATFLAKKGAMSEGDILTDRVSDYFSEFKPIVDEWRTRIYRMESNLEGAIVHDHIFQMLATFITKLGDELPTPLPSPVAPPSASSTHRTGAPPIVQPTAGSSLRRSLRLKQAAGPNDAGRD
ncbi:hypothetical protein DEU56DRAFT_906933 [Suillus clintonianus]|uniref:uncharacterized protein n=2 Tax=Suillus clintonianus TaxID=1904413 RepID=UPI001B880DA6|nr:uncharacterized protein DEU56DRAFT_906933 [Suillus clintonianus]KAG2155764.1 hypothetical protein DEU56DRAFT_906933 [Suillus clintonianus]